MIVGIQSQSTTFGEEEIEDSNIMTPVHSYTTGASETDSSGVQDSAASSASSQPQKFRVFRLIGDVYNDTEEIGMIDELFYAGVDEPATYSQAAKESEWRVAMQAEMDVIEKNKTCVLTELPEGRKAII